MYETYVASGYTHVATAEDPFRGFGELVLYNPTPEPCWATMTAYFQEREPVTLPAVPVKPETNALVVMPDIAPDVFTNAGFWGLKVLSTTPLMLNFIDGVRRNGQARRFAGGCTNFHDSKLGKEWRFYDGLWLEWNKALKGDLSKAPFPFNELEYYYFLNPGIKDAEVTMTLHFRELPPQVLRFTVPAERVYVWNNLEQVPFNKGHTIKVESSQPITTSAVRYIYDLTGFEPWGMTVHGSMPAVPGPIGL